MNTTDGGQNWNVQDAGYHDFTGVSFYDINNGLAVGYSGIIVHTTNGGIDWETQESGVFNSLNSVSLVKPNIGIVVGSNGIILKTTNSGQSWGKQNSFTNYSLNKVKFVNKDNGIIVGNSLILRTTNGGGITNVNEKIKIKIPSDFTLFQNYPNPFNPSTNISYQLAESNYVVLNIFNILGQKVRTLVNSEQTSGDHSVNWNGKDDSGNSLSSGIYIYRIKAGNFISSKKMVLLK